MPNFNYYREWKESLLLHGGFYALIIAAMRRATDHNIEILKTMYPDLWNEVEQRDMAPKGILNMRELSIYLPPEEQEEAMEHLREFEGKEGLDIYNQL